MRIGVEIEIWTRIGKGMWINIMIKVGIGIMVLELLRTAEHLQKHLGAVNMLNLFVFFGLYILNCH